MSKINGTYRVSREQLERMRAARMGPGAIAEAFGCDPVTVRFWLKRFGLPTKLPPVEITDEQVDQAIIRYRKSKSERLVHCKRMANAKH